MNIYVAILMSSLGGAALATFAFAWYIRRMDKMMIQEIEKSMKRQVENAEQQLGQIAVVVSGNGKGEKGILH
jgi:hypothetical protein